MRTSTSALALLVLGCGPDAGQPHPSSPTNMIIHERSEERDAMVHVQLWARGIGDRRVLAAMRAVPRHRFVPAELAELAYADRPLPIGHDVTISQPYIVASMTELARIAPGERVLEIGTGSGYQAAVLAELGAEVHSIERIAALIEPARAVLAELGYVVEIRHGDGWLGWPEHAPFDAIVTTAAADELPQALLDQLAIGGRLVLPLGPTDGAQQLVVVERTKEGMVRTDHGGVMFVPMLPGTTVD